jgi:hypothetical protein
VAAIKLSAITQLRAKKVKRAESAKRRGLLNEYIKWDVTESLATNSDLIKEGDDAEGGRSSAPCKTPPLRS